MARAVVGQIFEGFCERIAGMAVEGDCDAVIGGAQRDDRIPVSGRNGGEIL